MIIHVRLLPVLISWVLFLRVDAQRNVSLDDQDTAIVYAPPGAWNPTQKNSLDYGPGGAHMLTENPKATATFNFTGTAIYFFSPRWPYKVNVAISLDSRRSDFVDLVDHSRPDVGSGAETVKSQVVWNSTGLANIQHTLVISVAPGQPYAIVDGLMYTEMGPISSSTTTSSSSISSSSSASSSSSSSSTSSSSSSSSSSASSSSSTSSSSSASSSSSTSSSSSVSSSSSTSSSSSIFSSSSASFLLGTASLSDASSSSSTSSSSASSSSRAASTPILSTDNAGATRKENLSIAFGSIAGVLALLLIFAIVYFSRRRRRRIMPWTIDGSPLDGNSVTSNGNRNGRGYSQPQWVHGDEYPLVQPYRHSMEQTADGTWRNSQDGLVRNMSPPQMSPPHLAQPLYYARPQDQYDQYTNGGVSNRYVLGYTPSSIIGSSPPLTVGPLSPLLANSSSVGLNMLNAEDFSGYYTAPAPERPLQKQPLVVVGGSGNETEPDDGMQTETPDTQQLSPTDEESTSYRISSITLRRSV